MKIMRFLIPLLLSPLFLASAQQTSWQWINPLPQGNVLNSIWAVNKDTAVAVAEDGTVIRTGNGGTTWQVEPNIAGVTDQLFANQFVSGTTGWAVGETGRILKTTDGGASWIHQDISTLKDLFGICFISPTTGWVIGSQGAIFKTTDGGNSWAAESCQTEATLYGINFQNASTGWIVGTDGIVLATNNGGATWNLKPSGTNQSLYSVQFVSPSVGFAVGSFGIIIRSNNGGETWVPQLSITEFSLYSLQFTTWLTAWAVGAYGVCIKTTDGGNSWFEQSTGTYNDLYSLHFISSTTGWAVGDFGTIAATTDGGVTWKEQSSGVKNILSGIHFPTITNGWAVGEEGTIIRTQDAGTSWEVLPSGVIKTLYGVYMVSTSVGWAVGDSATVLKTTNGGTTWQDQNIHSDPSLYSVYFANPNTGWVVGDFGTIMATTNSGLTWKPESSNTFTSLLRVKFADVNTGWTIGYGGEILKTTNGGAKWIHQASNTFQALYALEVIDANRVYAAGDFGTVVYTTDGGQTWTPQTSNTDAGLYGLTFLSSSTGWAAGDDGTIIGTTDGGATWKPQTTPTLHTLWDIQLVRSGTGGGYLFGAGIGGTILGSAISPLQGRVWTGVEDSLWTTPGNWNPVGVPLNGDSVYIPPTAVNPVYRNVTQQLNLARLQIGSGARLSIGKGLSQLVVTGNTQIDGVLSIESTSSLHLISGGSFITSAGGTFDPGRSTVICTGPGTVKGLFYNLYMEEYSSMQSAGNLTVTNSITILADMTLRKSDTLNVLNSDARSLQGPGLVNGGTIKRGIAAASTDKYRFESPVTSVRFYSAGALPAAMTMTVYPQTVSSGFPDTLFVRRHYSIFASGGSNYLYYLSLRYDTNETKITIDNLALFKDSAGVVTNMGTVDYLDSSLIALSLDSVRGFSNWYFGYYDYYPRHPFEYTDSLFITNNGSLTDTLFFGAAPGATDGIDSSQGEIPLGPKPPSNIFDVRWLIPPTLGSLVDIKEVLSYQHQQNTYTFSIQPGSGGYPVTLRWISAAFPGGTVELRDQSTHGTLFRVDMKKQSSYVITNPAITTVEIVHKSPAYFQFAQGWNMISVPVVPAGSPRKVNLFPTAISNAFGYSNLYYIADTMKTGLGYWIKFASSELIGIDGTARNTDTIQVKQGWNMIGSLGTPVAIGTIVQTPPSIVISQYYAYATSYRNSDTILPSKGYWVKVSANGKLVLNSTGAALKPASPPLAHSAILQELNTLTITDRSGSQQTLYFGKSENPQLPADLFELPPLPPEGAFDARFSTNGTAEILDGETGKLMISLQSASWPVTISWRLNQLPPCALRFSNAKTGEILQPSTSAQAGEIKLLNPQAASIALTIEGHSEIPKSFALMQNYPNPFNPSTVIQFDLPMQAAVTLKIYNVLGQEVLNLADNRQYPAGRHTLTLDASNLGSGVYIYQFAAAGAGNSEFRNSRKMVLIK